jgi:hypothetical protein
MDYEHEVEIGILSTSTNSEVHSIKQNREGGSKLSQNEMQKRYPTFSVIKDQGLILSKSKAKQRLIH